MPSESKIRSAVKLIADTAKLNGISDVFYVGGYPRSMAMGLGYSDVKDLDLASGTEDKAVQLAGLVAEAGGTDYYEVLHRTMTIRIEVGGVEMDFQGPMSHERTLPYLHSKGIEPTKIAQNIFDRDFTINALMIPVDSDEIVDLTKRGLDDIDDRRIASILPPEASVPGNPLIITRAVRFAYKYEYAIEGKLWESMKTHASSLKDRIKPARLAIESYVLSKYDCEEMLEDLGLEYMLGDEMLESAEEIIES